MTGVELCPACDGMLNPGTLHGCPGESLRTLRAELAAVKGERDALQSAVDDVYLASACGTRFMGTNSRTHGAMIGSGLGDRLLLLISDAAKDRLEQRMQEIREGKQ